MGNPPGGGLPGGAANAGACFPAKGVKNPANPCGNAPAPKPPPAPKPIIAPLINMATPVVLVKKSYTATPARRMIVLQTDQAFDGTGTFTATKGADKVKFFSLHKGGVEIKSGQVFPGKRLSAGVPIFAEGVKPSSSLNDITIQLALQPGSNPVKPPAKAKFTSVEVTLDICKSRTKAGETPPPLSTDDKIKVGRFLQVQDLGVNAGRALLIVRKAQPKAFAGNLVLKPRAGNVRLFEFKDDPPAGGQVSFADLKKANSSIPASGLKLWVEGTATSPALRDTGYTLGVEGVGVEGDLVKATVVAFSEIKATIKPTPAHTPANGAAMGIANPTNHTFKSTSISRDFAVNAPLVLMKNAQPDIALEIKCVPANLPLRWQAIRNEADHGRLGNTGAVPTVTTNAADVKKATLKADAGGSFRVRCYIDCNDNHLYDDRVDSEPSIPLNLVLANAVVVKDNSAANSGRQMQATLTGTGVKISNGNWPAGGGALTKNDLKQAGMGMELIADVTGGGADGRLGLDKVFSGLINNLSLVDINAKYLDATVAPPKNWNWVNVYVSNRPVSNVFAPGVGGPVPAPLVWPILDTGRNPGGGTGGDTATMTRSFPHTSVNRAVGQRWTIRCLDSPGRSFDFQHPLNANAILQKVHYRQEFTANFCFWTNVNKNRGASFPGPQANDPADRVYCVLRIVAWTVSGDWNVTYPAAGARLAVTNRHRARTPSRSTINPVGRAQDHNVEVRPPSGITGAIAWDAR